MYDIYLLKSPKMLSGANPLLSPLEGQEVPCFLQLDLSAEAVGDIYEKISSLGGKGMIVSSEYRHPKISIERATALAHLELISQQKAKFSSYDFDSIKYLRAEPTYWLFGCFSPGLIQEGHHPGGVITAIDKLDGHVWKLREIKNLLGEEYFFESASTEDPKLIAEKLSTGLKLSCDLGQQGQDEYFVKGKGMFIRVAHQKYPKLIQAQFGVFSNTQILFKINPPHNKQAYLLMLDAVSIILKSPGDGILITEIDGLETILRRSLDCLTFNKKVRNWSQEELLRVPHDFTFSRHSSSM